MKRRLILVLGTVLLISACDQKKSGESALSMNDRIVGDWISDDKANAVKIESTSDRSQLQIDWNGEKVLVGYIEKTEYNEFTYRSNDLEKWNIEFYIKPLEENKLLVSSSNVEGDIASDSKPITYYRIK